ncbi:MAG: hypothetical protein PVG03_16045 [Desulfarculaceae bacterium]|jgi:hypothetical protein
MRVAKIAALMLLILTAAFTSTAWAGPLHCRNGAQFWAYVTPQNETSKWVTEWSITVSQKDGNWSQTITSDDPHRVIQTPGLSGIFDVTVMVSGPNITTSRRIGALPDSHADVGCNSNCAAMIGIVASQDGSDAHYWTVWDASCCQP